MRAYIYIYTCSVTAADKVHRAIMSLLSDYFKQKQKTDPRRSRDQW